MSEFERKYGKYALRNLPLIMTVFYGIGYVLQAFFPAVLSYLSLDPYMIIHGQVWRLITWLLVPVNYSNIFFVLIMLFCFYSISVNLERTWGTYKLNIYIFSGIFFMIIGAFVVLAIAYISGGYLVAAMYGSMVASYFSTHYIYMSILLAFAVTFPNATFLLMYFIPVKAKWMAAIYGIMLVWQFIGGNLVSRVALVFSLLNLLIFYLTNKRGLGVGVVKMRNFQATREKASKPYSSARTKSGRDLSRASNIVTRHKCAVCGRTEEDVPNMQFRFCTKCEGSYEYCEDHLYTHTHVRMS